MKSGFFNSVNGDRKYNALDLSYFYGSLITSGVMPNPSTNLQVMAADGMKVIVNKGMGWITPQYLNNDTEEELKIDQADTILNRIDAIVMVKNLGIEVRDIHLECKKGVSSTNPVPPALIRTQQIQEYCLAYINVPAKTVKITQSNIVDTRADTKICGWVTALIKQVDTSTLFRQWQTAYEEFYKEMNGWKDNQQEAFVTWADDLKNILGENGSGELLLQVKNMLDAMYAWATDEDIDAIIAGKYKDVDESEGIFDIATDADIDAIINGTYVEENENVEEDEATDGEVQGIIDELFR